MGNRIFAVPYKGKRKITETQTTLLFYLVKQQLYSTQLLLQLMSEAFMASVNVRILAFRAVRPWSYVYCVRPWSYVYYVRLWSYVYYVRPWSIVWLLTAITWSVLQLLVTTSYTEDGCQRYGRNVCSQQL